CEATLARLHSFPTRRSSDLTTSLPPMPKLFAGEEKDVEWATLTAATDNSLAQAEEEGAMETAAGGGETVSGIGETAGGGAAGGRSEEHTSELQSLRQLVCRL